MNDCYKFLLDTVKNKDCAVLGLGVSNLPLVRLLLSFDVCKSLTVYDKKRVDELGEDALALSQQGVHFAVGFDNIRADVIFRTPGIRPDIDGIEKCVKEGAVLTSEMESFLATTPARVFGITGSDGKTTTTTLTGKFLETGNGSGKTYVGGNIGTPLLDKCGMMRDDDCAVLELSSFQLMTFKKAPICSAITNLSPNHMDWHTDEAEYAAAKHNIVGKETRRVVLNAECAHTYEYGCELIAEGGREIIFFSSRAECYGDVFEDVKDNVKLIFVRDGKITLSDGRSDETLLDCKSIKIPGKHNIENYMTAIGLTYGFVNTDVYECVASEFYGVEHRLELVRRKDGVDYFNSSIDSSPTRTLAALSALDGRDIVAICGGYDKNLSYNILAKKLCESVRAVVVTGAAANKIKKAIDECDDYPQSGLKVFMEDTFEGAVSRAASQGREGGCVVLTPACASFDRFKNFAERGRYFKELVNSL